MTSPFTRCATPSCRPGAPRSPPRRQALTFIVYICGLILFFWFIYLVLLRSGQLQQEELDDVVAAPARAGMTSGVRRAEDLAPEVATPFAFGGPGRGSPLRFYFFLVRPLAHFPASRPHTIASPFAPIRRPSPSSTSSAWPWRGSLR